MKSTYIIYYVGKDSKGIDICDGNTETTCTNSGEGFLSSCNEITIKDIKDQYPNLERLLIKHICKL